MLRRRLLTVLLTLLVMTSALAHSTAGAGGPAHCQPDQPECSAGVQIPPVAPGPGTTPVGGNGQPSTPLPCTDQYKVLDPQPPAGYSWWQGKSPADYVMLMSLCPKAAVGPDGMWYNYVPVLKAQAPPPPSPAVLAQSALVTIHFPAPVQHFGPNPDRIAVNLPVWLSMTDPGAIAGTASAGGVSVQLSGRVSSVTWSVNEPGATPVTCTGVGSAPAAGADLSKPPCGFTFQLRSLPGRTGGAGTWTVTATAAWTVTWTSSTGASGTLSSQSTSDSTVYVGEYSTVILPGG